MRNEKIFLEKAGNAAYLVLLCGKKVAQRKPARKKTGAGKTGGKGWGMKITKNDRVVIETTNMVHGMLEQGGISGRRVSYPVASVMEATGMSRDELLAANLDDICPNSNGMITIREMIEYYCHGGGKVVRRGHRIH